MGYSQPFKQDLNLYIHDFSTWVAIVQEMSKFPHKEPLSCQIKPVLCGRSSKVTGKTHLRQSTRILRSDTGFLPFYGSNSKKENKNWELD